MVCMCHCVGQTKKVLLSYPLSAIRIEYCKWSNASVTGKVENLHAHVNRNLQHANPNLHVL